MIDELKRLLKHSGIYGISVVLSKIVGFLMIPVYTRCLTPADYGVLELLDLIVFFSGIFAAMGIYSAVFRFYSEYESERDKKEVISTALLYYAGMSLLLAGAIIALAKPLAVAIFGGAEYALYVRLTAFTLLFSNLGDVPLAYWRVQEKTVLFSVFNVLKTIVQVATMTVVLVGFKLGLKGVVYANVATTGLFGVTLFLWTMSQVPRTIVRHKLVEMLRYGAPLIVQSLGSFVLVYSDRFFLRYFGNLSDVGVYSLAYKLAGILTVLVTGPFTFAWQWQQFEIAKREDGKKIQARIATYQTFISLLLGLGISVLANEVLTILAPASYAGAARVIPLLVLSYVFANVRVVVSSGVLVQRDTTQMATVFAISSASNLALNWWLIPPYGMLGAAIATAASYGVSLILTWAAAQRVYHVSYEYGRNAVLFGVAAGLYLLSEVIKGIAHLALLPSSVVDVLLTVTFAVIAFALLDREERAMMWQLWAAVTGRLGRGVAGPRPVQPSAAEPDELLGIIAKEGAGK